MYKEYGVSSVGLVGAVAVVAVLVAGGAGYVAWENKSQVDGLRGEVQSTKTTLTKVRAELNKTSQEFAVASKDAKDLKVVNDRLSAERDAVRITLETEQAAGVRLRDELALAKEQVSYLSSRVSKDVVRGMPKTVASK